MPDKTETFTTRIIGKKKLSICRSAGFCFGVGRAVDMAMRLTESKPANGEPQAYSVGALVHNGNVLEKMRARGLRDVVSAEEIPPGTTVLIRSHGASKQLMKALEGRVVVDATCPCVRRIHDIVRRESADGRHILLLGDPGHPEVQATASWCGSVTVFDSPETLRVLASEHPEWKETPLAAVAQTTASLEDWMACTVFLKKGYTNVKILDTICRATSMRQQEAAELSRQADVMLVVGDRKSSNTRHLADACRKAVLLQSAEELDPKEYRSCAHIGITAGASTPAEIIEEVVQKMTEEMKKAEQAAEAETGGTTPAANDGEMSFAELLEASLKTLTTGEKVTGVITGITPTEIQVDLGTKHAGYIPVEELDDEQADKVAESLKVGDEIETFVVRVNDVEGTAMLSKKRLDTVKSWETVEGAKDNNAILEGTVVEENKGGVVVSVKGVRVFVPSSQTGLGRDVPMSSLLKTKVKLRITEFNRARRRVVGSIRSVMQETRRAQSDSIWENIEIGKKYQGVVKSLTSYGAFVDIGGIDGMVHVSELSWTRIGQPSDILKPGDPIEVHIINFDREKKKISLGHRKPEDNPWNKFLQTYKIDDVFSVKVLRLMPFGVFCEVLPGVDGLIHISQLADHRVGKPSDVVSEGDVVTVKLTEIDMEKKKVSLSIRALIEKTAQESVDDDDTEDEIVATSEAGHTAIAGDLLEDGELNNIAGAVADAVAEVAREEAASQATAAE